jgi:hypothetical protein
MSTEQELRECRKELERPQAVHEELRVDTGRLCTWGMGIGTIVGVSLGIAIGVIIGITL